MPTVVAKCVQAVVRPTAGAEYASWIVSCVALFAWVYVAGIGVAWWHVIPSYFLAIGYTLVLGAVAQGTREGSGHLANLEACR